MRTQLSINLNKIALLRNARGRDYPSVVNFAKTAFEYGAAGVTIHPRPDERHARKTDVYELAELLIDYPGKELNIEGNPTDDFMKLVLDVMPHQCTLVPDDPDQITSDHGWDLHRDLDAVRERVKQLTQSGIRSSIFMDPTAADMQLAYQTGTNRVELYTESYAQSFHKSDKDDVLAQYQQTSQAAQSLKISVNAGHDLNLENLEDFLVNVTGVEEVSIGHAIIVESLEIGFVPVLNQYLKILDRVYENN